MTKAAKPEVLCAKAVVRGQGTVGGGGYSKVRTVKEPYGTPLVCKPIKHILIKFDQKYPILINDVALKTWAIKRKSQCQASPYKLPV